MRTSAFRVAALAASALLHVLLYGGLTLAPAWTAPPRTGLVVTELIVTEPPRPAVQPPRLVRRSLPPATSQPVTRRVQTVEPRKPENVEPIERNVPEPPMVTALEPAPAATDAASAPIPMAPDGTLPGLRGAPTLPSQPMPGPAVAALPPNPSPAAPGALTHMAIPRGGYQITPSYPASARRLGIEGTALLDVFVDADGRVGEIRVKQSAGHPDLDRAAANAVRRWRFEPARRGAEAVAMWVELPVQFHLR
ncbi:MAG TPA: energy transducer TonB [Methylomirabilota bacterium]|jgi:protein TonB|nr:energy transducer TonB [Methylomirabilota bacterium]